MTNKDTDEISVLYQSGAVENAELDLDNQILARAKRKAADRTKTVTKVSHWRKWQWPFSVVASVALVSLIYLHNMPDYSPPSFQDEHAVVSLKQSPQKRPAAEADLEKVEAQAQVSVQNSQGQSPEDSIPERLTKQSDAQRLKVVTPDKQTTAVAVPTREQASSHFIQPEPVSVSSDIEEIATTGSRISISVLNEPYLTTLLDDIDKIKKQLGRDELSQIQKQKLNQELVVLHQNIYDELHEFRRHNPAKMIPDKYLTVLDLQQVRKLDESKLTEARKK